MLVLSRNKGQSIMIGDNIVVTLVDIRGDKVRLGIDAPSEIPVHREEIYEAIKQEGREKKAIDHRSPEGRALAAKEMKELRESDEREREKEERA